MQIRLTLLPALAALSWMISLTGCGGCGGGSNDSSGPHDAAPTPASTGHGTVSLAWALSDLNGQPIQCAQVGAGEVSLQLRPRGQATGTAETFPCAGSPGISQALDPATYDVAFELHAGSTTLATAADQSGVVVEDAKNTTLTPVAFAVDAQGGLVLSLAAPPTTSNCKSTGMLGAGINGVSITLQHTEGGCAPVTCIHTRGATTLQPYTVTCSSPAVVACIESDETLTVPTLPSGPYTIHAVGKIGIAECWKSDDILQVPARGTILTQVIDLAFHPENGGCW